MAQIRTPDIGTLVSNATLVEVTGSAFGPGFASYMLEVASVADPETWIPLGVPYPTPVAEGPPTRLGVGVLVAGGVAALSARQARGVVAEAEDA